MVTAGFNPRMKIDHTAWRRVATPEGLERILGNNVQPSLRDGQRGSVCEPWVKTRGYLHVVGPRRTFIKVRG
jgi:SH3-like domain-containing protein